jgi:hypothetical protein
MWLIRYGGPALRSRIGVLSGEVEPTRHDHFGVTVTRTARVMMRATAARPSLPKQPGA